MSCRDWPESADTDAGTSCRRSERFSAVTMISGSSSAPALFCCACGAFCAALTPAIDKHIVLATTLMRMTTPSLLTTIYVSVAEQGDGPHVDHFIGYCTQYPQARFFSVCFKVGSLGPSTASAIGRHVCRL